MRLVDSWVNCLYSKAGGKGSLLTCDVPFKGPVVIFLQHTIKIPIQSLTFLPFCLILSPFFAIATSMRLQGETECEDVLHWKGKGTFN